jgi:hypothetical protein
VLHKSGSAVKFARFIRIGQTGLWRLQACHLMCYTSLSASPPSAARRTAYILLAGPVGTATYQAIPKETLNFGVFGAIDAMEAEGDLDGPPLALGDHNRHENDGMGPLSPVAAGHGMAMPYDYMGQPQQPPALPPSAMGAGSMGINSVGGGDEMVRAERWRWAGRGVCVAAVRLLLLQPVCRPCS